MDDWPMTVSGIVITKPTTSGRSRQSRLQPSDRESALKSATARRKCVLREGMESKVREVQAAVVERPGPAPGRALVLLKERVSRAFRRLRVRDSKSVEAVDLAIDLTRVSGGVRLFCVLPG